MLARSGAEYITNADPEVIEVRNLATKIFSNQVGKNKAEMTKLNILAINQMLLRP